MFTPFALETNLQTDDNHISRHDNHDAIAWRTANANFNETSTKFTFIHSIIEESLSMQEIDCKIDDDLFIKFFVIYQNNRKLIYNNLTSRVNVIHLFYYPNPTSLDIIKRFRSIYNFFFTNYDWNVRLSFSCIIEILLNYKYIYYHHQYTLIKEKTKKYQQKPKPLNVSVVICVYDVLSGLSFLFGFGHNIFVCVAIFSTKPLGKFDDL